MRVLIAALVAVFLWPIIAVGEPPADIVKMHNEMLYPAVQVDHRTGGGSGTVIFSAEHDAGMETYVLTNFHVVEGAVTVAEEWDPRKKEKVTVERRDKVHVRWHSYNDLSRHVATIGKTAEIVAYDKAADLAVVKIEDSEKGADFVAHLLPEDQPLYMFEKVFAIGAGLGKTPFPTQGVLGPMNASIDGFGYLFASTPLIWGNSGGSLYHYSAERDRYELIGVPSRISASWGTPITHMAWSVKMATVRGFLRTNDLGFILGE